jgi:phosphoribosylformylglycinamidine cyclo-ligase
MLRTFNMGMGFLLVVSQDEADRALRALSQAGSDGIVIGHVVEAEHRVHYTGKLDYGD